MIMSRHIFVHRRNNCNERMLPCLPKTARALVEEGSCEIVELNPITIRYKKRPAAFVILNKVGSVSFWVSMVNIWRVLLLDQAFAYENSSMPYIKAISTAILWAVISAVVYVITLEPEQNGEEEI